MIRRLMVAVWVVVVVLVSGAAECDQQPSVGDTGSSCGFICQIGGGGGSHDPSSEKNPPKQRKLYDPDAHHTVQDKAGDRSALAQEKAANQKNLQRLCAQDPKLCRR